ncbi:hypothetical protein [Viridibacillus arvi]|uniref:hypothetical protein n=1 Tax=Viridibacillus arvi TaxID=263475 RepID=UPI00187B8F15|nr:hypothetical protein [Viridibacillus sp. JNUCC-6]QOV10513.1 hypothetical protein JNUCC6_18310 [Viridibacillus sp. JNUCC-6]
MTEILQDTIESYNGYLPRVIDGSKKIAENLRGDKVFEALKMILDFSEGMIWMIEASTLIKKNSVIVDLQVEKVQEYLNEINNGLEIQDYVLVADMFEYEIAPFFEECMPIEEHRN